MSTCEVHLYVHLIHLYVYFIYLHVHHTYMNICMMIRRVTGCKAGASTVISTGRGVMVGMLFVCANHCAGNWGSKISKPWFLTPGVYHLVRGREGNVVI